MSQEEQQPNPELQGYERRSQARLPSWRNMLDLHYSLRRDHDSLEKRVDTLTIGFQQLSDVTHDNFVQTMMMLTRIEKHLFKKEWWLAIGVVALIGTLGYILIKLWT